MKNFNYWKNLFDSENLEEFNYDTMGLLWLKTKSILRKELLSDFLLCNSIILTETRLSKQFPEIYDILSKAPVNSHNILNDYIKKVNGKQFLNLDTNELVSELYKLKNFTWGGDYQNSLDKYLISQYVKVQNPSFENLVSKLETEISIAVQSYVLNSWYNHWSSVLIEHIFKSHHSVLPAVGKIKSVDFFINNIPFDLKVTYLPSGYIINKRKQKGLPFELTYLKKMAIEAKITFDKKAKPNDIYYEISEKMKDKNDNFCKEVISKIKQQNLSILEEARENPKLLATWLYENQGEMRFGSENRLFLVLVDSDDFANSWKLKRNLDILKPTIISYLDNFKNKKPEELKIKFNFRSKVQNFTALTDIIFVVK